MEILDVRLACCTLHKKRLIEALKLLSSGERLEFIAENTETFKNQVQRVLDTENCKIIEVDDKNGESRIIVQKNWKAKDNNLNAEGQTTRRLPS
ncbi:MAG: sulfurtransferase TusA family protein [Nitrospirota bacterium]